jgi:hypothetical protein
MADACDVEIYRAQDMLEATLFQGALEAAGVKARVINGGAAYPGLGFDTARIVVAQTDAEQAALILRELEQSRSGRLTSRARRVWSAFAARRLGYSIGPVLSIALLASHFGGRSGFFTLIIGTLVAAVLYRLFSPPRPTRG